ncbi:unnamed protein product [Victoria cruziana]
MDFTFVQGHQLLSFLGRNGLNDTHHLRLCRPPARNIADNREICVEALEIRRNASALERWLQINFSDSNVLYQFAIAGICDYGSISI